MTFDLEIRGVALSYKTHKTIVEELQMILHESKLFSSRNQRWSFYKPSPPFCLVKVLSVPCTAVCACVSAVQVCMDVCVIVLFSWNELEVYALMWVISPPLFVILALSLLWNIVIIKICSEIEKKILLSFNIVAAAPWKMNSFDLNDPLTFSRKHDVEDQF